MKLYPHHDALIQEVYLFQRNKCDSVAEWQLPLFCSNGVGFLGTLRKLFDGLGANLIYEYREPGCTFGTLGATGNHITGEQLR